MIRQGEFDWIARYLAPLSGEGSFSLKDDAALLSVPEGVQLVVTQDAILEGIHFLPTDPVDRIASKALRVNVSDIVAKGAKPFAYSLALGVPDRWRDEDMAAFARGLECDQGQYGLTLNGGDTYRSPERLCVAVTMYGVVPVGAYKSRLGASPGDLLVVSGTIGNGAVGLKVATGALIVGAADYEVMLEGYQLPDPPLALAPMIAKHASASMDISDGLLGDCRKLCAASGLAATIERGNVPLSATVSALVQENPELWPAVLAGGDDYQCLSTIPPTNWKAFKTEAQAVGVQVSQIGWVTNGEPGKVVLDTGGIDVSIVDDSYSHF